jgi:hypothetical protein
MIVHQAVAMADPVIAAVDLIKNIEEGLPVLVVLKDGFLFIAPGGNVVNGARVFDAQRASHNRTVEYLNKKC